MKVLLVDDHTLFREGLALLLTTVADAVEVLHAGSLAQAAAALPLGPDLVLLDLALPGVSGIDGLVDLRRLTEDIPVVVLSGNEDPATMRACIDAGAMGYIPKTAGSQQMRMALRQVLAGEVVLPPSAEAGAPAPQTDAGRLLGLTPRQLDVLRCLVQGKTNKVIARDLGIHADTVKSHVTAVLLALGVKNRTEAVYAVRNLSLR